MYSAPSEAPSGFVRRHALSVDCLHPIGSLVVCLPSQFEGGNLVIRHDSGQEIDFDWGPASSSKFQWAAFHSCCEHKVKAISKGHRVTLTFNLYVTDSMQGMTRLDPIIDPKTLPLYGSIESLIKQPGFMKEGKFASDR